MEKGMLEREGSGVKSRTWREEEEEEEEGKVKVVRVIYYIARNGQLEHPHLMEVPLSSSHPMLCLKDVISRLNFLRGQGMAQSYSWSAKRSYKKGYVWQDLSENDFIYPCNAHDNEYILKGTQLFQLSSSSSSFPSSKAPVTTVSPPSSKEYSSETATSSSTTTDSTDSPGSTKKTLITTKTKMKEPWKLAAVNASTQTGNLKREKEKENKNEDKEVVKDISSSINNGEATALQVSGNIKESSSSSSSTSNNIREYCRMEENENNQSGRMMKASTVLMQLIRCVSSKRFHDCVHERA